MRTGGSADRGVIGGALRSVQDERADWAPWVERAAERQVVRVCGLGETHGLGGRRLRGERHTDRQSRVEQAARVGVAGIGDEVVGGRDLDDLAEVHDGDDVADITNDRQVVRDEEHRDAQARRQLLDEVEDGALHRHVQGAGDLVGDDHFGPGRERPGERDPLALPAGEGAGHPGGDRRLEVDAFEQFRDSGALPAARGDRLGDARADGHPRVERAGRVLEDHLDRPPPPTRRRGAPVKQDLPGGDRLQPDRGPAEG